MKKEYNQFYIIKKGDTIDKIAEKYHVSPISILIDNSVSPKNLKEGHILFIRR